MSDQPALPDLPSAELAHAYGDPSFQGRLGSGDQVVREAAALELNAMWARAVPEPAEATPSHVRYDGTRLPGHEPGAQPHDAIPPIASDEPGVPPTAVYYSFPHTLEPALEPAFRAAAMAARLTIDEAADLSAAFTEAEQVVGALRTDNDDASLAEFTVKRLGADGLAQARKGFAHLRRHAPALANRLEQSGSTNHPRLVESFARLGRRLR